MKLDFNSSSNWIQINYLSPLFWFGRTQYNASKTIWDALIDSAQVYGMTITNSKLEIEVESINRITLLESGGTNFTSYSVEPTQGLHFITKEQPTPGEGNAPIKVYHTDVASSLTPFYETRSSEFNWDNVAETYSIKKEVVPQHFKKTYEYAWHQPPNSCFYEPQNYDELTGGKYIMPKIFAVATSSGANLDNESLIYDRCASHALQTGEFTTRANPTLDGYEWRPNTIRPREHRKYTHCPAIYLAPPPALDASGYAKYEIRCTIRHSAGIKLFLRCDNENEFFRKRQEVLPPRTFVDATGEYYPYSYPSL